MQTNLLRFGHNNAKFEASQPRDTFSLPAGWTCPGANECLARTDRDSGKLTDGKQTRFRCFAASMEARHQSVRKSRWHNFETLKACKTSQDMEALISQSLPANAEPLMRVHVSGDFYSRDYFAAWMRAASLRPDITFYAYTKSLKTWVENQHLVPSNFKLNASKGGKNDELIKQYALKYAEVVFSEQQAEGLGLEIDHDDTLAYTQDKPFALLLHGTQPKGSLAAKALSALKRAGHTGYSSKKEISRKPLTLQQVNRDVAAQDWQTA